MIGATILLSLAIAGPAAAQGQPIRIVVGTAAGGAIDPYARIIAEHMSKTLGQPIIIENKPGASGSLAAQYLADNPADGTLLWLGTQAFTEILPSMVPNAHWSIDQFHPIIRGVEAPLAFIINPSVPANNFAEFVNWAKRNKGKLGYSSYQPGTPSHFLGFQLNEKFDLDLTHVPYRGSGLQVTGCSAAIRCSVLRRSTPRCLTCAPARSRRSQPRGQRATIRSRRCPLSRSSDIPSSLPRSGSGFW